MQDNPYTYLIKAMREEGSAFNPPSLNIGEVISPLGDLKIKVNGLLLDKTDLLISEDLVHSSKFIDLKKGDKVLVFPTEDNQTHIIVSKVVAL